MEEWRKIRLGDACVTNKNSYSPKKGWEFVNYLDTGNITNNRIDSIQYIDMEHDKLPSRARRKVNKNSIIYSTVRPNQRHFGIIKTQPENFLVSTGFTVIDVDNDVLDADFLYYLLTQSVFVEALHAIAEQSTSAYPSIKPSDIEDLEIEIPDLDTQKKIACVLGSMDKKVVQNTEVNNHLREFYEPRGQIRTQSRRKLELWTEPDMRRQPRPSNVAARCRVAQRLSSETSSSPDINLGINASRIEVSFSF